MNFSHLTVLIVEDDMSYRIFMRSLMQKSFQMHTLEATNPLDAFEILKDNRVDLIILDMQMPAMDGATALALLRKDENTKDIPVIVSSALSHFGLLAQLSKIGISDYIVKPSDVKTIIAKTLKTLNSRYSSISESDDGEEK